MFVAKLGSKFDKSRAQKFEEKVQELVHKIMSSNKPGKEIVAKLLLSTTEPPLFTSSILLFDALAVSIAGITEEGSKFISHRLGFLNEYLISFNVQEFTQYVFAIIAGGIGFERILEEIEKVINKAVTNKDDKKACIEWLRSHEQDVIKIFKSVLAGAVPIFGDPSKHFFKQAKDGKTYLKISPETLAKRLDELRKKQLRSKIIRNAILARLFTVLVHYVFASLHKKNRTFLAMISHMVYNIISILVVLSIHKKIRYVGGTYMLVESKRLR
jgi:hypothetical protein